MGLGLVDEKGYIIMRRAVQDMSGKENCMCAGVERITHSERRVKCTLWLEGRMPVGRGGETPSKLGSGDESTL